MCGLGKNHKIFNKKIKNINDLNKVSLISGKKKRKNKFYINNYLFFLKFKFR